MTKPVKPTFSPVPTFTSEADERAYWETGAGRDSTEHLDWSKARKAALPNLKPTTKTISLRLPQHLLDALKVAANSLMLKPKARPPAKQNAQCTSAHPSSRAALAG